MIDGVAGLHRPKRERAVEGKRVASARGWQNAREREREGERDGRVRKGERAGWWLLEGRRANAHNRGQRVGAASLSLSLLVSPLPGRVPFSPFLSLSFSLRLCVPRSVCFARDFSWNPKFFVVTSFVSKFPFEGPFLRAI